MLLDLAAAVGNSATSHAWLASARVHAVATRGGHPPSRLPPTAAHQLHANGFVVVPNWLPRKVIDGVKEDMLASQGKAREAGVGTTASRQRQPTWRVDETIRRSHLVALHPPLTSWVESHPSAVIPRLETRLSLTAHLDGLCSELNALKATGDLPSLRPLRSIETELGYVYYPTGGFYERHVDVPAGSRSWDGRSVSSGRPCAVRREVSVLIYLDDDWQPAWGGTLRIHKRAAAETVLDVPPVAGTLVLLRSDTIEHEVRPTHRPRQAVVGWLRTVQGPAERSLRSSQCHSIPYSGPPLEIRHVYILYVDFSLSRIVLA